MPSLNSLRGIDVRKWVSGTTYGLDTIVWSPLSKLMYARIVAGAGTTDPASDTTNWTIFGPTRRKSLQYVTVTWTGGSGLSTADGTISAVNTAKCRAQIIYTYSGTNALIIPANLSFPNSTTVRADNVAGSFAATTHSRIEVEEMW